MSHSPTYVSRLDPQFRRFVNVVNVYPSSDTSASNEDLSKDRGSSLAFSSCSDLNQEFITVDAYTEDIWPPTQGSQRQVSELFLEYATILSSESETSFANDNDIATCSSASPSSTDDTRILSNSEQRYSRERIRYDCFEGDSVFWSDVYDETSDEEKTNEVFQRRLTVSNKRQPLQRSPNESFSSKADSERSCRFDSEPDGRLEHMEEALEFFDGKYFQERETIGPVSRHRGQEVISGYPQGTSRQIADSFDDLSSLGSELGYAPDVIEDGYSSTSSADSSFVYFALTGKQDVYRPKRKDARIEHRKKYGHGGRDSLKKPQDEGKDADQGLMACVVTGISGGPTVRVFRDQNSNVSTKSRSRSLGYQREEAQPHSGRVDGGSPDQEGLKRPHFRYKSVKSSGHDSVFALIAAPGNSLVKDEQSSRREGNWGTERKARCGPEGADERVSAGFFENFRLNKPDSNLEGTTPTHLKTRVEKKRGSKDDDISSRRGDKYIREPIYAPVSSVNTSTKYDNVNVMPNAPANTASDFQQTRSDPITLSKENVQPSHSLEQTSSGPSLYYEPVEGGNQLFYSTWQNQFPEPTTTMIMRDAFQGTAVSVKVHSTVRAASPSAIRGSVSQGQRPKGNLEENEREKVGDTIAPTTFVSELRLTDAGKMSEEKYETWPSKEKNGINDQLVDLSELHVRETMDAQSSPSKPTTREAFGSYKDHKDRKAVRNLKPTAHNPNDKTRTTKDTSNEDCSGAVAKAELLTPVKTSILKTIKDCPLDTGASDGDWKMGSMEEDQVCPNIKRDESVRTELKGYVDVVEDQKARVRHVEITEGHQTEPGSIRFTEIKGLKKISLKKRVDASSDKREGVAFTENVDVIGTTEVDECNQENKVKGINQSTSAISDTREPPVEERSDVLHTTKDRITDSNEREIDKKRSVDDVSQGPLSRTIQQQTHTPVIEDTLGKYRSTERKGVLNTLPKHHEKPSKLTGDLRIVSTVSGPYLWRRSSDTAHENLTKAADSPLRTRTGKESERYYKTEREAEQVFEEGHRCRSMDKIIRSNDVDDGNNNSLETDNGNNGYSLVPVFKRKVDEAFGEEESLKKKVEIITSCEQSRREDEVEESTRKAEVMDENFETSLNVTDERSKTQTCKTDSKHYGEGVSLESSAPASVESHSIPETEGNRISKKTRFSKTSRRQLEVFTNNGGFGSQLRGNLSDPRRPREIDPWRGSRNIKQEGLESVVENKAKESRIDVIAAGKRRKEDGKKTHLPLNSEETSLVLLAGVTVTQGNSQIRNESKDVTSVPELKGKRHITAGLSSENQETAASPEPDRPLDMESHGEDETFAEKTPETTSSSVLQSAEDMKNGDVKKNERHGRPMMASPLFERVSEDSNLDGVISQEALSNNLCTSLKEVKNGNQRYSRNTNTLKGDSNVSAVDIKLSTAHFTQQPSALTTFSDKETSGVQMVLDTSKKIFEMGKRDSCHGADRTDFLLEKDGQFLILKGDSAGHRRGLAVTPQTAEEHGLTEDVCFVAFDANSNAPEIGALPTTELVFSRNLDETADFLDHKAASPDKSNEAAVAESEIHSEVARLVKVGEVDSNSKTAICKTEVEEVVCRYEEGDSLLLSVNRVEPIKIRQAYSDGNYLIFGDEKLISNLSIGAQDPRTRRHEGDVQKTVSKATAGTVDTHTGKSKVGGWESVGEKRTLSSSQAPNETFLSSQSKANRKDNTEVTHGGASCRMSIHCDCLQEYLLHNGKGTEEIQRPVASANLEKLDANANMVFHTGTKTFDTFPGHRSGVKEYADKKCQVALLDDSTKPDYQTRESQTSFSYKSLNAEYQTNEVIEVSSQEKALQHQSVQCQTELQTIASVGVQVKVPDQHAEDKNLQRETGLVEEGDKGVQSLRTSRFPVNDDKVMQDVTESSHGVSFDSKECQTSGNSLYELEETGTSTSEDVSCRLIILESKECQTSLNTLLVTSSTQCEVITAHNGTDDLTVTTVAASRADKDCQVLPNSAPLQARSKECQTLLWPCASDKNEKVSAETEMSYESKECQTLLDRDFVRATLEELQTSSFHYPFDETKKESKECQTLLEADHIEALFQDIAKPSEEGSEKYYETKESQTYLDPGLLFVASKECQTPTWSHTFQEAGVDTKISYDSKECQTLLECNLLLGTSKYCQTSSSYSCGEVGLQTEEIDISYHSKECQTTLDSDLLFATSKHCQTSSYSCGREVGLQTDEIDISHHSKGCQTIVDSKVLLATSKECQTSWFSAAEETTGLGEEVEIVHLSRECQTEIGPLSSHSKECQTTPEFDADGPLKILSEFESHQYDYVTFDSKECQTDPVLMNGHSLENGNKPADSFEVNKQTHETKDTQTSTSVSSSKFCQTSSLRSDTDYRSRESQTLPEGDVFLSSSKECQTFPYSLQELKLLIAQVTAPKDVGLLSDAEADEYSNSTYPAPVGPLQATSRPSTYGESPDVLEESVTVFTSRDDRNDRGVCQANVELAHKSSVVPVDFAEIGCQAVLCHCGKFVDEHENDSSCSSDPQSGAAMRVSEGMQKEQASLIKQLDILRDMNQKLRDDKDAIEAAHEAMLMAKKERGHSLSDEIEEAEKKNKVPRQGSQMSKYVKRRRKPSPEDTWGNQGLVESLSGDDVDGSSDRSDGSRVRRRSKRRDMKKQGSVMSSYFGSNSSEGSVSLHGSIQEEDEAEFEGDPTLEIISYEKAEEMEQPAWAKKLMSVVQPREVSAEEDQRMTVSDEELEEDVFRTRKAELISRGPGRSRLKEVREESDMSFSEELSDENGSASDERPPSPRGAPVGKDNEMCRVGSQDMSEAGVSAISEPSAPERVFKVVFVGDSGVGKSSFIHRFCHDAWKPSFTATIGVDFQIKTVTIDGRCIALQLWDTAGQERFRSITKQYFRKADGVIVFYDVTMETSFLNIKNWMISVEEGTDDGTAIMIVGNKTDLIEEDSERPVRIEDGKRLAEEYKALYTETSAKTGFNIQESMAEFSKMLQVREDELMQSVLNLVHDKPTKKKCCK